MQMRYGVPVLATACLRIWCPRPDKESWEEEPREAQRSPEQPRGAQRSPEEPRGAQRSPEQPRGTQRSQLVPDEENWD